MILILNSKTKPVGAAIAALGLSSCALTAATETSRDYVSEVELFKMNPTQIERWTVFRDQADSGSAEPSCIVEQRPIRIVFDAGALTTLSFDYPTTREEDPDYLTNAHVSAITIDGEKYNIRIRYVRPSTLKVGIYSGDSRAVAEFSKDGITWASIGDLLPVLAHSGAAIIELSAGSEAIQLRGLRRAAAVCGSAIRDPRAKLKSDVR